jgi:hypothetical protein
MDNESALQAMRKRAYLYARHMIWDQVAQSYMQSFVRAGAGHRQPVREAFPLTITALNVNGRLMSA